MATCMKMLGHSNMDFNYTHGALKYRVCKKILAERHIKYCSNIWPLLLIYLFLKHAVFPFEGGSVGDWIFLSKLPLKALCPPN